MDVLYGNIDTNEKDKNERWWEVINCIKEGIWKCRNLTAVKNVPIPADSVAKVGISSVRDYIIRDRLKYNDQKMKNWWKIETIPVALMDNF